MPGGYADISRVSAETHARFKEIVYDGEREALGMSGFKGLLSEAEVEAVHAAFIKMQRDVYAAQSAAQPN